MPQLHGAPPRRAALSPRPRSRHSTRRPLPAVRAGSSPQLVRDASPHPLYEVGQPWTKPADVPQENWAYISPWLAGTQVLRGQHGFWALEPPAGVSTAADCIDIPLRLRHVYRQTWQLLCAAGTVLKASRWGA